MKLQRILKVKMSGEDVNFLQTKLKQHGFFKEKIDSFFGQNTLVAVTNFQRELGIKADGTVGSLVWNRLKDYGIEKVESIKEFINEDITNNISFIDVGTGLTIYDNFISEDKYVKEETKKETIWLHNTGGGSRPDWSANGIKNDIVRDKRGNPVLDENGNLQINKIASSYIIGRKSSSTNEELWDGKILRTFDDRYWANHLSIKDGLDLNSKSISIEICNYGPLILGPDGRFYNSINKFVSDKEVVKLENPYRGYEYYERYTDAQLENTRKLLIHLINKHGIRLQAEMYDVDWFNYSESWFKNGGIRSYSQIKKDVFDIFPQKEMIQMLNSL
jgi:peptidoglycan hydrolase-like protein with peptidoglycan-binding domain